MLQNKWIKQLINSESDARQIRSLRNKRIADNKEGRLLFGKESNPFLFLNDTLQPERLEKLKNAYIFIHKRKRIDNLEIIFDK